MTPLIGGYIADSYLGRYRTILTFCTIYLGGLILVVFGSIPGDVTPAVFFPAIYIVALGTGGIKPNVSTMGADQFDDRYSQDRKEKESFFNWFYWSVNLGSLISYTLVAYICQYGLPFLGGEKWGFFVGYTIPAIMMGLAITIFFMGTKKYRIQLQKGSVLAEVVQIVYEALWLRRGQDTRTGARLDRAKLSYGGSFNDKHVEGVKLVARIMPFLLVMVPYWGIYSQMSTAFQNQACQMDLDIGSLSVPVSALNCFDTLSILLLVPVFDGYIYPYFKEKGYPMTMLVKIGCGFALASLGMVVAGGVEAARLAYAPTPGNYSDESARDNITPCQSLDDYNPYQYQDWYAGVDDTDKPAHCHQICNTTFTLAGSTYTYLNLTCISCDNIPQMSGLSVFWQIFQFMILGTSEILASITSLEFFYSQAPTVMRSVSQSLNLATTALGSFMIIPLLYMVNANPDDEWVPMNLDDGHLDYYFFLLAGLMLLTLIFLYYMSLDYEYKHPRELRLLEDDEGTSDEASGESERDREESEATGEDGVAKRTRGKAEAGRAGSRSEAHGGSAMENPMLSVLDMQGSDADPPSRFFVDQDAHQSPFHGSAAHRGTSHIHEA